MLTRSCVLIVLPVFAAVIFGSGMQGKAPQALGTNPHPQSQFAVENMMIRQVEGTDRFRLADVKKQIAASDRVELACVFRNVSDQELIAYNVIVSMMSASRVIADKSFTYDATLVPGDNPIAPSATVNLTVTSTHLQVGKTPTDIQILLDYAEYSNGSAYGRNLAGGRQIIRAQRSGKMAFLQYLKVRYLAGDEQAVRSALGIER